jgi:hypothetical protein
VTEDRPYRPGLSSEEALRLIKSKVADGGLDGRVVATLRAHLPAIDLVRRKEQAAWSSGQARLNYLMETAPCERDALSDPPTDTAARAATSNPTRESRKVATWN